MSRLRVINKTEPKDALVRAAAAFTDKGWWGRKELWAMKIASSDPQISWLGMFSQGSWLNLTEKPPEAGVCERVRIGLPELSL